MEDKAKGMRTCQVCGREFPLLEEEHYLARDCGSTGIGAVLSSVREPAWYDVIDCPHCGCQNVLRRRKLFVSRQELEDVLGGEDGCENRCGCEGDDDGE